MAGEAYLKRYVSGFTDQDATKPVDAQFLNAVETALVRLLGSDPSAGGVPVWDAAAGHFVFQKLTNAQIDAAAAIDKTKLAPLSITDSDVAAGAAISGSKIAGIPGSGAFSAVATITTTPTINVATQVQFDSEEWDDSGWFASNTYTPQLPGRYLLIAFLKASASFVDGSRIKIYVFKNGATLKTIHSSHLGAAADDWVLGGSCTVNANGSTDAFGIRVEHNSAGTPSVGAGSYFQGALVRAS